MKQINETRQPRTEASIAKQVLPAQLRAGWRSAVRWTALAALIGGGAMLCRAERAAHKRDVEEVIFALRYAVMLSKAGLPPGEYPALDACVRLDQLHWHGCAEAVITAGVP